MLKRPTQTLELEKNCLILLVSRISYWCSTFSREDRTESYLGGQKALTEETQGKQQLNLENPLEWEQPLKS